MPRGRPKGSKNKFTLSKPAQKEFKAVGIVAIDMDKVTPPDAKKAREQALALKVATVIHEDYCHFPGCIPKLHLSQGEEIIKLVRLEGV